MVQCKLDRIWLENSPLWSAFCKLDQMQAKQNVLLSNINLSMGWRDMNMSYDLTNVLIGKFWPSLE